jgi:16S rRNA processing protein RimM
MDRSDSESTRPTPALLEVGHIRRPHGLRGEVFVQLMDDIDERVKPGAEMLAGDKTLVVETSRVAAKGRRVVKFVQIVDRTAAETYTNMPLHGAPIEDPAALWVHELIGGRVVELDGTHRGICVAVLANPAADILELDSGHLVPSNFVVTNIEGIVKVDTPDGLFDLEP